MAKPIQETDETTDILESIEEAEKALWPIQLEINTLKLNLKEQRGLYDRGLAELRRLARTRLEENPLFDDGRDDDEE